MKKITNAHHYLKRKWQKYLSLLIYYFSGREKENQAFLKALKDKHRGQRAFIVCNGPSLSAKDLDTLANNNEISFACNKINKIYPKTKWRPTYYAVLDAAYQYLLLDEMNENASQIKFFRKESYLTTMKVSGESVFLNVNGDVSLLDDCKFSNDCSEVLYAIATTTYAFFQLAVYMGIKDIYIIGCDNKYSKEIQKDGSVIDTGKKSYFEGADSKEQVFTAASTWQMNIVYEYARVYSDAHDINIYNATRGGCLESFERVDFDKLF